jgi:hypothetical protein
VKVADPTPRRKAEAEAVKDVGPVTGLGALILWRNLQMYEPT